MCIDYNIKYRVIFTDTIREDKFSQKKSSIRSNRFSIS